MNTKLRNLVVVAAVAAAPLAMADNTLVVHTTDEPAQFAIASVQRLTLGEDALTVLAGAEHQFPYPSIVKLDFRAQTVGDVTGDGTVDISDVNAIINIMLGKTVTSDELLVASDLTGDGKVDITDVNNAINMMLGKSQATASPAGSDRMLVYRADGSTDVFEVDRVTDITFVEIPEATTSITLVDADDSSVRARVTKTEGTARYEVACYAASDTPDDIEAYIQAHKKFNRKNDGVVEFIDLNPSTDYVVAALAYDEYDIPCEVSTLAFATAERVISAPAQVGDYLYSDGSWSTELKTTKSVVGIVYSTDVTDADRALGYTNGYAVALKDAAKAAWATEGNENQSGSMITDEGEVTDREGLTRTRTMLDNAEIHPAAQAAHDYAAAPYGTSGWFLPAAGQWVELMANLGGLDAAGFERSESGVATWSAADAAAAIDAVNTRLSAVGQGKYELLNKTYYWSATERSVATAYYLYLNANYNMSLQLYYKNNEFDVRPVIAF